MGPIEKKIVIRVNRTVDNKPYANIMYQNGTELQSVYDLDYPTKLFANYIAKKTVTNEIQGLIYSFDEEIIVDRFDISPLTDNNYCIYGSEIGRKSTTTVIKNITEAASQPEIMAPVYLTDGYNTVLMNDELLRRNSNMPPISKEELDQKYQIIESIVSEEKNRRLNLNIAA